MWEWLAFVLDLLGTMMFSSYPSGGRLTTRVLVGMFLLLLTVLVTALIYASWQLLRH